MLRGPALVPPADPVGLTPLIDLGDAVPLVRQTLRSRTNATRQQHAAGGRVLGRQPVLMAYAVGYSDALLNFFVNSYQSWVTRGRLVLFTADGIWPARVVCRRPASVEFVKIEDHKGVPHVVRRYFVYAEWLSRRPQSYSKIILSDVRDVFFQADPFLRMREDKGQSGVLYAFAEGVSLRNKPTNNNQRWIRQCRYYGGEASLQQLLSRDASVVNGGVVAASTPEVMLRFLRELVKPLSHGCNDQGAITYIVHVLGPQLGINIVLQPLRKSFVANALEELNPTHPKAHPRTHLAPLEVFQDALGRILNSDGEPYAIVHQADRFPALWRLRHRILSLGMNRTQNDSDVRGTAARHSALSYEHAALTGVKYREDNLSTVPL